MAGATSSLISLSGEIVEVMMTIIMIPIDNNNNNNKGRVVYIGLHEPTILCNSK